MRGNLIPEKVFMAYNVGDVMTKSLPTNRFYSLTELMGVERSSE